MYVLFAGTVAVLLSAAWTDVRYKRIPNLLVFSLLLFQIFTTLFFSKILNTPLFTMPVLFDKIKASVLVLLCLYPFFAIGELGAGDVKLLTVTVFSVTAPLVFILMSFMFGGVLGIIKHFTGRKDNCRKRVVIQMAIPILLAFVLSEAVSYWRI